MAYERKTYDEWRVYCDYGEGYEEVYADENYKVARENYLIYLKEDTFAHDVKLVKKRVPKHSKLLEVVYGNTFDHE